MDTKQDIMYILEECHKHGDNLFQAVSQIKRFFKNSLVLPTILKCVYDAAKDFLSQASGTDALIDFTEQDYGTISINKYIIKAIDENIDKEFKPKD